MCIRDSTISVYMRAHISTKEPVSYTHLDVYKRQRQHLVRVPEVVGEIPLPPAPGQADHGVDLALAQRVVDCLLYTSRCV